MIFASNCMMNALHDFSCIVKSTQARLCKNRKTNLRKVRRKKEKETRVQPNQSYILTWLMKITHQSNLSIRICNNDNRVLVQEALFSSSKSKWDGLYCYSFLKQTRMTSGTNVCGKHSSRSNLKMYVTGRHLTQLFWQTGGFFLDRKQWLNIEYSISILTHQQPKKKAIQFAPI